MLERAVRALGASGGAVWLKSESGAWTLDSRVDQSRQRVIETLMAAPAHRELLQVVLDSEQGRVVLPHSGSAGGASPNPTEFLIALYPMSAGAAAVASDNEADGELTGVLEVVQRPGGSPSQHQGYLRLLAALCEMAGDFHRQRRVRVLQAVAAKAHAIERFGLDVHASLEVGATALAVANEGRRLIDCDRLSVAVRRPRRMRVVAVSGVESVDPRANVIRRLEDLVEAVLRTRTPFWQSGEREDVAPQIALPLDAWRDASQARSVAVIPLAARAAPGTTDQDPADPIGALVVERFGGAEFDEACRQKVAAVCRHAELALGNALEHESLPFYGVVQTLGQARWFIAARQLPKTVAVLAAIALIGLALLVVPADFAIEGRGLLQPQMRRNVFARSDGIVTEVRADHGKDCEAGDVLAVMTRSQLEFETTRVLGELATARQRLSSVQATRLKLSPQSAADREKYNQLTAEETELRETLNSLERQHEILKLQQDDLLVRSPLTGTVVTWNVRQLLEARPVQKGQILMQVADRQGPWVLEVEVPDDRIGHVLEASRQQTQPLAVTFLLATDPGTSYYGTVSEISLATDVRPPEKATVLVTVSIQRDDIPGLRPGATAVSRIHCGRRSIGFVWFHSLWETIQKKVLF
ncbi:MAG: HlyD family efflux transporter periplasmic adaptor subunit [Planctomycetes bacterium]|nr:HlyD family efflux transporter periplasmic adaptor subunit [Planctomycetota bacterium]